MNPHYRDYFWKMGKPYGLEPINSDAIQSYKIIADPYYKRISIEKYKEGKFSHLIYDSILLDFRHLRSPEQIAWQRELLVEEPNHHVYLLRNQDDRAILQEIVEFEKTYCRSCLIQSVHGIALSTHRMYYKELQDTFNGVILYDQENRPIMQKIYEIDPLTREFDQLVSEEWNMEAQALAYLKG